MMAANYKTKKALKEATGQKLQYTETSLFGSEYDPNMKGVAFVGPSPYQRKWYAQVWLKDGIITKVT
jgi:hypothetical protein